MFGIFRRIFGGNGDSDAAVTSQAEAFDYKGYTVQPAPIKEAAGWRVAGVISREIDGETRRHEFIRADVFTGESEAVDITSGKARRLVDEQGDRMFRERD